MTREIPHAEACLRTRNRLLERAAEKRLMLESGGMTVGGIWIATDTAGLIRLDLVREAALADKKAAFDFKGPSGWVEIGAKAALDLAAAPALRLQKLFSAERRHHDAIMALPDDEDALRTYDIEKGWPS